MAPRTQAGPVRICTIAASNYLPRVRVLAESVRRHGHSGDLVVFLVDDPEARSDTSAEPFVQLPLDATTLDPTWFARMTLYYDVTELATAVKPWVLEAVANGAGPSPGGAAATAESLAAVAYLDPDTELLAPLDDLWAIAAGGEVVLTPHTLAPFPRDGLLMAERTLLQAGTFNLGFVALPTAGVGPGVLAWWQERLRFDALVAPEQWLFTDQLWMNLAPVLFPCHLVTDRGVNVAFWNLHERPLSRRDGVLCAGDDPLRLMHFSGIDPRRPHLLSANQAAYPRVLLSEQPELAALCEAYLERIAPKAGDVFGRPGADGAQAATDGYRWGRLPNGITVQPWMRRRYRSELVAAVEGHVGAYRCPPEPLGPSWLVDLMSWWCEPAFPRMLPRMVDALSHHRPELAGTLAWPVPTEAAHAAATWLATTGVDEEGLTPAVALRLGAALREWATACDDASRRHRVPAERVVNVVGIAGSASGLATATTQLEALCASAGIEHRMVPVAHPHTTTRLDDAGHLDLFGSGPPPPPADIAVVGINANTLGEISPLGRRRLFGDSYRVGYWWWEVDRMPDDYRALLDVVDEIWVGSTHVASLFRGLTDRPVHRVPLPPRQPTPGDVDLAALGVDPATTLFTFAFDHSGVLARKNPLGLIEAWRTAFTPDDGCTLVIKTVNHSLHRVSAEALRHAAAGRPDIVLVEEFLDASALDGLLAASSAYVSLHRAEGLGLGMLDAALLGVPVIATATGGCMDFLDPESSWLVPGDTVAVGPGSAPYPPDATWCEPDLEVAVAHLRAVAADPGGARATAEVARARALDTYDERMCVDLLRQRVQDIRSRLAAGWSPVGGAGAGRP